MATITVPLALVAVGEERIGSSKRVLVAILVIVKYVNGRIRDGRLDGLLSIEVHYVALPCVIQNSNPLNLGMSRCEP